MNEDHKKLIDWYIKREVKAAEKSPTHGQIFLDRILDKPKDEVEAIQVTFQQDLLDATRDLKFTPRIRHWSFAKELVSAYRNYFLGIEE